MDRTRAFLKSRSGEMTLFAMIEKGIEILISLLTGILVVRRSDINDLGVISAMSGYATIINVINISPINYLYKEYSYSLKDRLDETISSYIRFEKAKFFILVVMYLTIGIYLSVAKGTIGFIIVGAANGLSMGLEMLSNIDRCVLELHFLQKKITKTTFICRIVKLVITLFLFLSPQLWVISLRDISVALIGWLTLRYLSRFYYKRVDLEINKTINDIKEAFSGFCLANHFSGVLTNFIYGSDTMFLSIFWSSIIVGRYGITLTCLNYFNPFFQVLQKNTMIELGTTENIQEDIKIVKKYSKLSLALSVVSYMGYIILGRSFFLAFTGESRLADQTYRYGIFIFAGVCLYNCVRPLTSFLCLRGNINRYLIQTLIPAAFFSLVMYYVMARYQGAMMLAVANVLSYGSWTMLVLSYFVRYKDDMGV